MWDNDFLRAAAGILFLLVLFRQLTKPEVYDRRAEFERMVYSSSEDQQRAVMALLQSSAPHVHWKNCKEVILPICSSVIASRYTAVRFCRDLSDYCRRYEPNTYSTPDYG